MKPIVALVNKAKGLPALFVLGAVLLGMAAVLAVVLGCTSCAGGGEGFAIYETTGQLLPRHVTRTDELHKVGRPVVSSADVVSYNLQTHELKLTDDGFQRIADLNVPVEGKSFLVCVDGKPVYFGAFWVPVSSISYSGVTIWKPYDSGGSPVVTFELGYPSPSFYKGADPRNDPRIIDALRKAGKLLDRLSVDDIEALPASLKGYELYSWERSGTWHYTVITGTDRTKTADEVTSPGDFISESGWIKVTVDSIDRLETVLGKLPSGASVLWLNGLQGVPAPSNIAAGFDIPPSATVQTIKDFASQRGIDLSIAYP